MSRLLLLARTLGGLERPSGFLILPVIAAICTLNQDIFRGGWNIFLLISRSIAETVYGWIGMFLSVLSFSSAPVPKSVSKWEKLWHRASGLFAQKTVEPVRNPVATWVLKTMKKTGIPHADKVVDFVSGHFFEILQALVWLVIILVFIHVCRSQKMIMAKLRLLEAPEVLNRIRLIEASIAILIQQVELHAVQVAPVVINVGQQPAQACDLDRVCMATPFVPGYGIDSANAPPPASEPRFADMLHRLLILEYESRSRALVAQSRQDGTSAVAASE